MTVTGVNRLPSLGYDEMAEVLADSMCEYGFAFVEEPMIPALSAWLRAFIAATGLPVNPPGNDGAVAPPYQS